MITLRQFFDAFAKVIRPLEPFDLSGLVLQNSIFRFSRSWVLIWHPMPGMHPSIPKKPSFIGGSGSIPITADILDTSDAIITEIIITDIPEHDLAKIDLSPLTTVKSITLRGCGLSSLPAWLQKMPWIHELHIKNSPDQLTQAQTTIPKWVLNLQDLWHLAFEHFRMPTIPALLFAIPKIHSLWISKCGVMAIQALDRISHIKYFNLIEAEFSQLLVFFEFLPELESLLMVDCKLKEIPITITQLPSLSSIWFNNNEIATVPEFLIKMPKLQEINLSNNKIHEIPKAFAEKKYLRNFFLENNAIRHLPMEFRNTAIRHLGLLGNPIEDWLETFLNMPRYSRDWGKHGISFFLRTLPIEWESYISLVKRELNPGETLDYFSNLETWSFEKVIAKLHRNEELRESEIRYPHFPKYRPVIEAHAPSPPNEAYRDMIARADSYWSTFAGKRRKKNSLPIML
jgi:hypothetical protein